MKNRLLLLMLVICFLIRWDGVAFAGGDAVPLPEHPRPDFQRAAWLNLNGEWKFRFDSENTGMQGRWFADAAGFPDMILVPFPWGSPLSRVPDKATIAWYARTVHVPEAWRGQRI